ncbi:GDSL-type esterase/lipase family protein [Shewanella gelidimarina]|uniref:GDSL-type esterase/lipase family protein n=1 Tax=Shewanella gelidimarina TaxID=56813 RepID=UPI00200EB6C6|nr:GDSL-type esterase/lipase family protein [Shewanella gelidimarina]MCL1056841.1 GDSL-type esterase/lipase family protein [Shewanella gelidimarina]
MRNSLLFIILSLALLLQACQEPKVTALSNNATVIAFGDSLTAGVGATKGMDYPSQLANISGLNVINAGVSGETTRQGAKRLPSVLAKHSAELLILLEGGNDFLRNQSKASTKANLAAMIEQAQLQGTTVLLVAVPQKSLFLSPSPIYAELAEEYRLVLIEDALSDLLSSSSQKSDAIHLNDSGYLALAKAIFERINQ